jgi:hypothetical protein
MLGRTLDVLKKAMSLQRTWLFLLLHAIVVRFRFLFSIFCPAFADILWARYHSIL